MSKSTTFIAIIFLNLPLLGWSWNITPTLISIDPEKPQAFFTVSSEKTEQATAIEITACPREINEVGEEKLGEKTKDFLIYPSQIILKSGETKTIRVVWKGSKQVPVEKAYRLIANSLPVKLTDSSKKPDAGEVAINIAIGTRYLNSLYVASKNAKPNVVCVKSFLEEKTPGKKVIVIELANQGNAHHFITNFNMTVENESEKYKITKDLINKLYDGGINILAKQQRIIRIPVELVQKLE